MVLFAVSLYSSPKPIQEMVDGQQGMIPEQMGTGIAHHLPYSLPHDRFVAMYGAPTAYRLSFLVRTFVETPSGIGQEGLAIRAKIFFPSVPCPAPQADHCLNGL
jgi:hypothetical protein